MSATTFRERRYHSELADGFAKDFGEPFVVVFTDNRSKPFDVISLEAWESAAPGRYFGSEILYCTDKTYRY